MHVSFSHEVTTRSFELMSHVEQKYSMIFRTEIARNWDKIRMRTSSDLALKTERFGNVCSKVEHPIYKQFCICILRYLDKRGGIFFRFDFS